MLRSSWAMAVAGVVGLASALAPRAAHADLPPPDGTKFVGFELAVDNADESKDYVIVAYPCSDSFMPTRAMAQITKDATKVGRRGGPCALYAMSRTDYADWVKGHDPKAPNNGDALDDLFKSGKVHACDGARPDLTFTLPTTDPRTVVHQTLHVAKVDQSSCTMAASSSSPAQSSSAAPSATPSSNPTSTPTGSTGSASPSAPPSAVSPPGCGGCSVNTRSIGPTGVGALALLFGIASLRRRKRR